MCGLQRKENNSVFSFHVLSLFFDLLLVPFIPSSLATFEAIKLENWPKSVIKD